MSDKVDTGDERSSLLKAIKEIRAYFADELAYLEDLKARGDLTKEWGAASHTRAMLSLHEVDRILLVNHVYGIAK